MDEFDTEALTDEFWTIVEDLWDMFIYFLTSFVDLLIANAQNIAFLCIILGFSIAAKAWMRA